ncbi:hypothetical protein TrVGV298_007381 [Trichoderma virens]|nr:hypothetical protein TrVGV298_007381 [Trichoderma virens]
MSKYAEMAKGKLSSGREKASEYKGKAKGKVTKHIPGRGHKDDHDAPTHRTGSGLAPPPPPSSAKRSVVTAPSKYQDPHGPKVEPPPRFADESQLEAYEAEQEAHPVSSGPYRVNTTGLSTDHLPPPPVRRDAAGSRSPPSYDSVVGAGPGDTKAPSLPPRLPPRSGSGTPDRTASPLSTLGVSSSNLNQGAVNRLGAAGINVPAFGIGSSSPSHADDETPPPKPPRPNATPPSQLNELQNRFARLGTSNTGSSTGPPTPPSEVTTAATATATTWAQKQAAIKAASPVPSPSPTGSTGSSGLAGLAGKKKPPPPPPKKKPSLSAAAPPAGNGGAPPPIPMSTRPSY